MTVLALPHRQDLGVAGAQLLITADVLWIHAAEPVRSVSSAVAGGGTLVTQDILCGYVDVAYGSSAGNDDPTRDLARLAGTLPARNPYVGLLTAVPLDRARVILGKDRELRVAIVLTVGMRPLVAAGRTPAAAGPPPGTINVIALVDADLSPGAHVNALLTIVEARALALLDLGARTAEGYPAAGTATDAVVVACVSRPGRGLPYAGPITPIGHLLARCVREGIVAAAGARGWRAPEPV